ncbi:DUF4194 domain-containing protein [Salinarimonas sp. NSM]|uniref:DUF4194 domain-containing protein n=1 Tax=Salinarimonas sp. NSM TaxID=3458003 RepID=UPI0040374B2F
MALNELEAILDRSEDDSEALERDLRQVARALLERQFLVADDHGNPRRFELVRAHRRYFENLFHALGYELVLDERTRVVGIKNRAEAPARPLKRDHALFLLALRIVFQQAIESFALDAGGRCRTTVEDVWSLIEERAQGVLRPRTRGATIEIAREFQRNGICRLLEEEESGGRIPLEIRDVITLIVTIDAAEKLRAYARTLQPENAGSDGFATADPAASDRG